MIKSLLRKYFHSRENCNNILSIQIFYDSCFQCLLLCSQKFMAQKQARRHQIFLKFVIKSQRSILLCFCVSIEPTIVVTKLTSHSDFSVFCKPKFTSGLTSGLCLKKFPGQEFGLDLAIITRNNKLLSAEIIFLSQNFHGPWYFSQVSSLSTLLDGYLRAMLTSPTVQGTEFYSSIFITCATFYRNLAYGTYLIKVI